MRNKVTNKIRSVKSKYNIQLIEDNADNPKAFWKTVKRILPGEPKTLPTKICVDSEECINKFKIILLKLLINTSVGLLLDWLMRLERL